MTQETLYTIRYFYTVMLERAKTNTVELSVYRDGSLVSPASGTVTVYSDSGDKIVDAQAVTISNSIATYEILDTVLVSTLSLSTRWTIQWDLVMPDRTTPYRFTQPAALVLRRLYPVITDEDLEALHTELRDWKSQDHTSYQGYIDAAWKDVLSRLMEDGKWANLILSPESLRPVHLLKTVSIIFRDYSSSVAGGKYEKLADLYDEKYEKRWDAMTFVYDMNEDALIDDGEEGIAGVPVLLTTIPANWTLGSELY